MPACREQMARARRHSRSRCALCDRRPPAGRRDGAGEATAIYWLLVEHDLPSGRAKARRHADLRCSRHRAGGVPGSGVRPDKTNIEIRFHNDNAYNNTPPDYVGLLCLRQAMSGGHSRVISFHTAHNALLARHPNDCPGSISRSGLTGSANFIRAKARSLPPRCSRAARIEGTVQRAPDQQRLRAPRRADR